MLFMVERAVIQFTLVLAMIPLMVAQEMTF